MRSFATSYVMTKYKQIIFLLIISPFIVANSDDIEEIVTTGSLINNPEENVSPVDVLTKKDFNKIGRAHV